MKVSKWQVILAIFFLLIFLVNKIILSKVKLPSPTISSSEKEIIQEEPKIPEIGKVELPKKDKEIKIERIEEDQLPELDIWDIPIEELPSEKVEPKMSTKKTGLQPREEPDKFHKYPSVEELKEIKQKGLIIY